MEDLKFYNTEHKNFYNEHTHDKKLDGYNKSLIYLLGLTEETRNNYNKIYDETVRQIDFNALNGAWQTGTTMAITKLAFNLFNGFTGLLDSEANQYAVDSIFCYKEYAPYFYEGIRLRFNIQEQKSKEQQEFENFINEEERKLKN